MKKLIGIGIIISMVGALAAPLAAFASTSGTTTVSGDLDDVRYDLTVPSSAVPITLVRGGQAQASVGPITATTDGSDTKVTIAVKDANLDTTNAGKMKAGPSTYLTNPMQIAGGDLAKTALTGEDQQLATSKPLPCTILPALEVYQTVATGDSGGSYSITLTFTATYAP